MAGNIVMADRSTSAGDLRNAIWTQNSPTHTISLPNPFRFVLASRRGRERTAEQEIWKSPHGRKKLFSSPNPLKSLETAKEMFAKIWRKQAFFCENLDKKLGRLAVYLGLTGTPAT